MTTSLIAFTLAFGLPFAQHLKPPEQTGQFNFWVGEWNAAGKSRVAIDKDEWQETTAHNSITRTMDGHVVQEHFTMGTFQGSSWSVYVPASKSWKQTWVDNQGGYIALSGGMAGHDMILRTQANPTKPDQSSRMVFTNIRPDSFDWNWELTRDGGKIWQLMWRLHYVRKS